MKKYLKHNERIIIEYELKKGSAIRAIARFLKRAESTIRYEINKINKHYYMAEFSHLRTKFNLKQRGVQDCSVLHKQMLDFINENYNPKSYSLKQLLRIWKKDHPEAPSLATIYNWIPKGIFSFKYEDLLYPRSKRQKTIRTWKRMIGSPIKYRSHDFPDLADEAGHWEGDLVVGKNHKSFVLTLLERKSRFGITKLITSKNADNVLAHIKNCLANNSQYPFKSITFDNGLEFTKTQDLEQNGIKIYFAFPYSSWQRGRNENWNRMLRRWYPKGTDFSQLTDDEIGQTTDIINNIEREILGWQSSKQVLESCL